MCPNYPARSQSVPGAMLEDVNSWRKRQVLRQMFQTGLAQLGLAGVRVRVPALPRSRQIPYLNPYQVQFDSILCSVLRTEDSQGER